MKTRIYALLLIPRALLALLILGMSLAGPAPTSTRPAAPRRR
jgi:hypothetical protein